MLRSSPETVPALASEAKAIAFSRPASVHASVLIHFIAGEGRVRVHDL